MFVPKNFIGPRSYVSVAKPTYATEKDAYDIILLQLNRYSPVTVITSLADHFFYSWPLACSVVSPVSLNADDLSSNPTFRIKNTKCVGA